MKIERFPGALFLSIMLLLASPMAHASEELPVYEGVGGEFSAKSSLGREISLSDYRDKAVLLFFGYTSCQDICPAAMGYLKALMAQIGSTSDRVQVLFVTVDPGNDTAEHLAEFLSRYDPRFVGVTGSDAEVGSIAEMFMAKHDSSHGTKVTTDHSKHKTFTESSLQYAHSQQIYLLDRLGRTRALFFVGSPLDEMEAAIRFVLD